ncbi:MAG: lysoplasmalogenase [Erysipelotrichaceae bacterium]|nr:lysoplasmalogenase [Erysipelotrichaceae bacterium]MBQ1787524.1 lysoplasmalogenase [Erysipelotrichaceae bacterium]MBQ5805004.1 lysoplasmalogenase [Erysipelotrichaceae bacterium]
MKPIHYLFILAGFVLQALFIKSEHEEKYLLADILKGAASLMFVLIGYNAFQIVNNPFNRQFFYGLLFGMIGDILLNLRYVFPKHGQKIFLAGILAFLIGHILYLVALIPQARHVWIWYCIIIGALAAGGLLAYIFKTMEVKKAFKIFGVFYLGAVFIMTAIALGIAIFTPTRRAIIYAIGAVLFTASDVVLIFNTFSGVTKFSLRITNLTLYYIGQILIACSLFF